MIRTFYVTDKGNVHHSVGIHLVQPTPTFIARITTDDRDYEYHDPSLPCDPSSGVALQLKLYINGGRDLTKLPYFRTYEKL